MITNPYDPTDPASVDLARYRHAVITEVIPSSLAHVARNLDRVVHLICTYGLGEALRFDAAFYTMVRDDLAAAAARIRHAAGQVPVPSAGRRPR